MTNGKITSSGFLDDDLISLIRKGVIANV